MMRETESHVLALIIPYGLKMEAKGNSSQYLKKPLTRDTLLISITYHVRDLKFLIKFVNF